MLESDFYYLHKDFKCDILSQVEFKNKHNEVIL